MKFSPFDFLAFARASQHEPWATRSRRLPFKFSVTKLGLVVTTGKGSSRTVSHSEIAEFCKVYGQGDDEERATFKRIFNSSYLVAIASRFDARKAEFHLPEELAPANYLEGAVRTVQINAFERDLEARKRCIEENGDACFACGFNFASTYGDYARGFIHVHHRNPLALLRAQHQVDPARELVPVCPNCHAVIHLYGRCLTIEEVKAMLSSSAEKPAQLTEGGEE